MQLRRILLWKAAEKMLIWVNPRLVDQYVMPLSCLPRARYWSERLPLSGLSGRIIREYEPFLIPEQYYGTPVSVHTLRQYGLFRDLLRHREDFRESLWYRELSMQQQTTGVARHKQIRLRSKSDIDWFFCRHVLGLIESMDKCGYLPDKARDIGGAIISADGSLHKTRKGRHRFCAAQLLGVERIPLRVLGMSREWLEHSGAREASFAGIIDAVDIVRQKYSSMAAIPAQVARQSPASTERLSVGGHS